MANIKTRKMGMGASLVIVVLAFSAFAGAASLITKNQFGTTAVSWADEGEGEEDESEDEDENEDEDGDEDENKDDEREKKAKEAEKKRSERAREAAKKQLERMDEDSDDDTDEVEDEAEDEDDTDEVEGDDDGDERAMYKDRDKTLDKLQEKVAEAEKHILEKQAEGVDVTVALARLAAVKAGIDQVGVSFDQNNLDAAKALAKQVRKMTHFTEKDIEYAEKISDELAKIEKRFGQVNQKITALEALGGNATAFKAQLADLQAEFAALKVSLAAAPETITRDTVKAFEKRVKRLKSLVESTMFAYGGEEDDDLLEDHEEDADDLAEDLNDVAEVEEDDDNNISERVRGVASVHQASAAKLATALKDIRRRDGLAKAFFGPNTDAIDELNEQIAGINTRAASLESVANQVTDQDIKQILLSQAEILRSEALKLQSYTTAEGSASSLFGWLVRLF